MDIRLKKTKDFDLVFRKGKKLYSNSLTLVYLKSEELKVGFVVGKKHGKAVKRNKIKRLLRESFRSLLPIYKQDFFFVFLPKVRDDYTLDTFKRDMEYLLKKASND